MNPYAELGPSEGTKYADAEAMPLRGIPREQKLLNTQLERLAQRLTELWCKLEPVLGPETEASAIAPDEAPLDCPLARDIWNARHHVSNLAAQIEAITDQVQL